MKFDVLQLDNDIKFLRDEASRLRSMESFPAWARTKVERFESIAEKLRQVRQGQQMTTVGGKRLSE